MIRDNNWIVTMHGGMARHEHASFISFASLVCHEVGHFLGGLLWRNVSFKKLSAEGQSDYFATAKCMRKIFSHQENLDYITNENLHPYPKLICDLMFKEENNVCLLYTSPSPRDS